MADSGGLIQTKTVASYFKAEESMHTCTQAHTCAHTHTNTHKGRCQSEIYSSNVIASYSEYFILQQHKNSSEKHRVHSLQIPKILCTKKGMQTCCFVLGKYISQNKIMARAKIIHLPFSKLNSTRLDGQAIITFHCSSSVFK